MLREKTHYKSNTISIPFQNQIIKIPVAVEENEEKWKILSKSIRIIILQIIHHPIRRIMTKKIIFLS